MMRKRGNSGFTLTELLVVMVITSVLILFLGFEFVGWQANYRIESQTKQFYADLMEARTRAITRNFSYLVAMTAGDYLIAEDSNGNGTINNPGDTPLWGSWNPKNLEYGYQFKAFDAGALPTAAAPLAIDTRGFTSVGAATRYIGIDSTGRNPDYDCVIITQGKIQMGKWNAGTSCQEK